MSVMLNCQEVSRLLSEQRDRALTPGETLRLKLHLSLCKPCSNVEDQLAFLRTAMKRLGQDGAQSPEAASGEPRPGEGR